MANKDESLFNQFIEFVPDGIPTVLNLNEAFEYTRAIVKQTGVKNGIPLLYLTPWILDYASINGCTCGMSILEIYGRNTVNNANLIISGIDNLLTLGAASGVATVPSVGLKILTKAILYGMASYEMGKFTPATYEKIGQWAKDVFGLSGQKGKCNCVELNFAYCDLAACHCKDKKGDEQGRPPEGSNLPYDPLVIDLDGDGIETIAMENCNVHFDLDNSGFAEKTGWISPDDGFIVLDRNGDGEINNGAELFGDFTPLKNGEYAKDGYSALADFDDNGDLVIDANDAIYNDLRIWQDFNTNGTANDAESGDKDELKTLAELNIKGIALESVNQQISDGTGNSIYATSYAIKEDGTKLNTGDVLFKVDTVDTVPLATDDLVYDEQILALPNLKGYGNNYDLRRAMAMDTSGELMNLVTQYVNSNRASEKNRLLEKIIFKWTGVENVNPHSRGQYVDAQKLAVMESFWGQKYVQILGADAYGNPNIHTGPKLMQLYEDYKGELRKCLDMQSINDDLMSRISYVLDSGSDSLYMDITSFMDYIDTLAENNEEEALLKLKSGMQLVEDLGYSDKIFNFAAICEKIAFKGPLYLNAFMGGLDMEYKDFSDKDEKYIYLTKKGVLIGNSLNNRMSGSYETDVMYGNEGADVFWGSDGDDIIYGDAGADILLGQEGNDKLLGGAGDDYLEGGRGNDTYYWNLGDGNDNIYNYKDTYHYSEEASTIDVLRLGENIAPNDITLSLYGNDLHLNFIMTGEVVTIENWAKDYAYQLNKIVFLDGDVWTAADINKQLDLAVQVSDEINYIYGSWEDKEEVIAGTDGMDNIDGRGGNDTIIGGKGDDTINGGDGNDTYLWNIGDGNDIIYTSNNPADTDILKFGAGISREDIAISQYNSDLRLTYKPSGEMLTLQGFFGYNYYSIARVEFADGTLWTAEELSEIAVIRMGNSHDYVNNDSWGAINKITTSSYHDDKVYGTERDDSVTCWGGNNTVYGYGGDDTIIGSSGNDYFDGGEGDDRLEGGEGDDTLLGGAGNDILIGGAGKDTLYGDAGDDELYGREDDDTIYGGSGNDYISGGAGNDILYGGEGDDRIYGENGDDIIYTGDGNDDVSGGLGNDIIYADGGTNKIYAGDGDDVIVVGAGKDNYLDVGKGNDSVSLVWGTTSIINTGGTPVYGDNNTLVVEGWTDTEAPQFEVYYNGLLRITDSQRNGMDITTWDKNPFRSITFKNGDEVVYTLVTEKAYDNTAFGTQNLDEYTSMVRISGEGTKFAVTGGAKYKTFDFSSYEGVYGIHYVLTESGSLSIELVQYAETGVSVAASVEILDYKQDNTYGIYYHDTATTINSLEVYSQYVSNYAGGYYQLTPGNDYLELKDRAFVTSTKVTGTGADTIILNGDGSLVETDSDGSDIKTVVINGNNNRYSDWSNDVVKQITVNGDNNDVTAGNGKDTITITGGSKNKINGYYGMDTIVVTGGRENILDGGQDSDTYDVDWSKTGSIFLNGSNGDNSLLIRNAKAEDFYWCFDKLNMTSNGNHHIYLVDKESLECISWSTGYWEDNMPKSITFINGNETTTYEQSQIEAFCAEDAGCVVLAGSTDNIEMTLPANVEKVLAIPYLGSGSYVYNVNVSGAQSGLELDMTAFAKACANLVVQTRKNNNDYELVAYNGDSSENSSGKVIAKFRFKDFATASTNSLSLYTASGTTVVNVGDISENKTYAYYGLSETCDYTVYTMDSTAVFGNGNDVIRVTGRNNTISGGAGDDVLILDSKYERSNCILGGQGNDSLYLRAGGYELQGEAGNDSFFINMQQLERYETYVKDTEGSNKLMLAGGAGGMGLYLTDKENMRVVAKNGYSELYIEADTLATISSIDMYDTASGKLASYDVAKLKQVLQGAEQQLDFTSTVVAAIGVSRDLTEADTTNLTRLGVSFNK